MKLTSDAKRAIHRSIYRYDVRKSQPPRPTSISNAQHDYLAMGLPPKCRLQKIDQKVKTNEY